MKIKALLISSLLLLTSLSYAQDEFDALRITPSDIQGTARYTAMAGAFTAIGGDASAVKDNPAALGIYRHWEATFTLGYDYKGTKTSSQGFDRNGFNNRFNARQAGFVFNFGGKKNRTRGLITNSLAFTYDHLYDFRRDFVTGASKEAKPSTHASLTRLAALQASTKGTVTEAMLSTENNNDPYSNLDVGWLAELGYQSYLINPQSAGGFSTLLGEDELVKSRHAISEYGGINEYGLSWGGNINNYLFIGAGIGLRTLRYRAETTYAEHFEQEGSFQIDNEYETSGVGVNFSLGVMGMPTDWLRLGASIKSVTLHNLKDYNIATSQYYITEEQKGTVTTPKGGIDYSYKFNSPMQVTAGAAFFIKSQGIISIEYDFDRYQSLKFRDKSDAEAFTDANNAIKHAARNTHTLKIGAEYRPLEWLSIRAGYARQTPSVERNAQRFLRHNTVRIDSEYEIPQTVQFASAGIGFRGTWWNIDLAYQYRVYKSTFYSFAAGTYYTEDLPLDDKYQAEASDLKNQRHSASLTFGIRF